jgi:hypothetical protein
MQRRSHQKQQRPIAPRPRPHRSSAPAGSLCCRHLKPRFPYDDPHDLPNRIAATWQRHDVSAPCTHGSTRTCPQAKKVSDLRDYFSGLDQAADIEPPDAKGQGGVNRSLGLMWIHAEDREAGLSATQESTSVDRTERSLEIRGCGEPGRNVSPKTPFQSALQTPLVGKSRYPFRGVRRSRWRQISSFPGRVCPSRCTARRSTSSLISTSSTRRTRFRSDDQR